jgi:hypothetical protein
MVPCTEGYAYGVGVWDLSIIQGAFSVAPCQTLTLRFATFASLYGARPAHTPPQTAVAKSPPLSADSAERRTASPCSSPPMRSAKRSTPPAMVLMGAVAATREPAPAKHSALPATAAHLSVTSPPDTCTAAAGPRSAVMCVCVQGAGPATLCMYSTPRGARRRGGDGAHALAPTWWLATGRSCRVARRRRSRGATSPPAPPPPTRRRTRASPPAPHATPHHAPFNLHTHTSPPTRRTAFGEHGSTSVVNIFQKLSLRSHTAAPVIRRRRLRRTWEVHPADGKSRGSVRGRTSKLSASSCDVIADASRTTLASDGDTPPAVRSSRPRPIALMPSMSDGAITPVSYTPSACVSGG